MKILNRKNDLVDYDEEKLFSGIIKAAEGTKEEQTVRNTKHIICQTVLDLLQTKVKYPTISDITKTIPEALMKLEFYKTANNFIQYATIHKLERSIHKIDPITTIDEYINKQDWRVKANANQGYSLGGMILNASGKMSANYWLDNIYPEDAGFAHRNGDIHIHDLDMISGYCAGWSLKNLLNEGFNGIEGKIEASAPKNLSSAMGQMVNFLGSLQNEFAGAQAFSSFDTYLAPFVRKRKLELEKDYEECCCGNDENHTNYLNVEKQKEWVKKKLKKEVLQQMQVFIYNLNVPSRWGCVDMDTEVLTPKGWKTKDQLKQGDEIYSINMKSKQIEKDLVKAIIEKDSDGKLYEFSNRDYLQRVTENHRVLTFEKDTNNYKIEIAKDLINRILKTSNPLRLPITCEGINQEKILSDAEVKLAAFLYTDGSFEKRHGNGWRIRWRKSIKKWGIEEFEKTCANLGIEYTKDYKESEAHIKDLSFKTRMNHYTITSDNAQKVINIISNKKVIDEKFFKMTRDQARMFLDIWSRTDGQIDRHICQCDNEDIVNGLQHIAILAGYCTRIQKKHRTTWVKISRVDREITCPSKVKEIEYTGKVWCPSVLNNGTAVFRRNGFVFISGQTQTPFTNVTFDIKCPDMLKTQVPMIGGIPVDQLEEFKGKEFTYGDLEDEMTLITQCYFEVMAKGDSKGQIFTFPIPTINIGKSFDWNNPELDEMWEAEAKYGLAYFQNFVNSDLDESMIRSMCCRLQLDLHELLKRGNGLFGSAEQTGSIGVVTINCARLGYLSKGNKEELYNRLDILLELCKKVLEAKRKFLTTRLKDGFYPFAKRYLGTWRNHFNTIGVNGINEMLLNFNGTSTADKEGIAFAEEFLEYIRSRLKEFQEETGNMYNLEATPGEGTCYRFAKEDKKQFGDKIIQAGMGENIYYNNSSQLPVGFTDDIFEALDLQEGLQRKYTGGSVLHLFLGERVPNGQVAKNIIRRCFEKYKIPYLTLTPTFSICPKHGYIAGEHEYCPICDEKIIQTEKCKVCK